MVVASSTLHQIDSVKFIVYKYQSGNALLETTATTTANALLGVVTPVPLNMDYSTQTAVSNPIPNLIARPGEKYRVKVRITYKNKMLPDSPATVGDFDLPGDVLIPDAATPGGIE